MNAIRRPQLFAPIPISDADRRARLARLFGLGASSAAVSARLDAIAADLAQRLSAGCFNELDDAARTDLAGLSLTLAGLADRAQALEGDLAALRRAQAERAVTLLRQRARAWWRRWVR